LFVSLPADRLKEIRAETITISNMVSLSAHLLSHFLGEAHCSNLGYSSSPTILPLPTQRLSTTAIRTKRFLCTHQQQLSWWREHLSNGIGSP